MVCVRGRRRVRARLLADCSRVAWQAPMKYFGGTPIAYFAVFGMKDLLEELVGDPD